MPEEARPSTPAAAIRECDSTLYPNLYVLLQIACTLPFTSCECERSASTLRRLNNYMRASMGKSRLSSLALLHIHYNHQINLEQVVDVFSNKHPRRMELEYLLKPWIKICFPTEMHFKMLFFLLSVKSAFCLSKLKSALHLCLLFYYLPTLNKVLLTYLIYFFDIEELSPIY